MRQFVSRHIEDATVSVGRKKSGRANPLEWWMEGLVGQCEIGWRSRSGGDIKRRHLLLLVSV